MKVNADPSHQVGTAPRGQGHMQLFIWYDYRPIA